MKTYEAQVNVSGRTSYLGGTSQRKRKDYLGGWSGYRSFDYTMGKKKKKRKKMCTSKVVAKMEDGSSNGRNKQLSRIDHG